MTTVAVATSAYLDLTFEGLPELPGPGQERFARELLRSPGGGAITAVGLARLGVDVALASPLGDDDAGAFIRAELDREGIATVAARPGGTPVSVILPVDGDRAMVTWDPGRPTSAEELQALEPRGVVCGLHQLAAVPEGALAYATCGDDGARAFAGRLPAGLGGARALLVNQPEAALLTGLDSPQAAAERLAAAVETVVVTLGRHGAVGVVEGQAVSASGFDVGPPADTTGAGDLFAAAFVWADLRGADPDSRVRWAALYAALSVTSVTGVAGAVTEPRLIDEGMRHGLRRLPVPAGQAFTSSPPKER